MIDKHMYTCLTADGHDFGLAQQCFRQVGQFCLSHGDKQSFGERVGFCHRQNSRKVRSYISSLFDSKVASSACSQDGRWHLLLVEPVIQLEMLRKKGVCHRSEVHSMVNSTFEGTYSFAVSQRKHSSRKTIFE